MVSNINNSKIIVTVTKKDGREKQLFHYKIKTCTHTFEYKMWLNFYLITLTQILKLKGTDSQTATKVSL